ncbi:tripartite tricarboxylate transporter substrate binding protein [Aquincola sp. S2]|uniref:Tripartite tricarboxylate transporter substrate binding protein n=1 Tax=Pseudaquabacterium terrae TaxID=2732868 RepID=A0ABX2EGD2_9BURK|nr:tripartite tricarboxylate transporter substrate binding protein [Aquabacterium terrae]NRF67685.1 tripartite tricarboxylate transporter substrate binding protein [Aquabacterium terrae]
MKTAQHARRALIACAGALIAAASAPAFAQNYPSQPIRIVVPYPAGGATDTLARLIATRVQETWGQTVIVDNKPGASGMLGNDFVAKAAPDGHTVLLAITAIVQLPALKPKMPYDVLKDLQPLTMVASTNSIFAVPASTPAQTLKDFVALAKAQPGKLNYGSYGVGTSSHIQGSLLNLQAGLDLTHVPYKGAAPLLQDLKGGQLSSAFIDMATARPHLDSLKVLAATGTQRNKVLPNVPTFAELGFHSFEPIGWFGLFMPAGVPAPIAKKFAAEAQRIVQLPEVASRIEALGMTPGHLSTEEFARTVRADAQVYARIIKDANIQID